MTKDLGLAQDAATRAQSATPLGSLAHQVLYWSVLYCTVLYCAVLYCAVLYCIVL